ncbi:MAG: type IX secretion system membrane protein PorP/SprF [Bacteroidetes bacterium]|nr:type IX secretion system membrane protein PorP/SprF [Bacteroidota bacterium]
MKKLLLLQLALFLTVIAFGQRDAFYYQYLNNYHILNPAFTGTQEKLTFNLTDRHQWVGVRGAPNTITFDFQTVIKSEKVGIGGYIYTDRLGPALDFGLFTTYAYILEMPDARLSFGLQFGFKQTVIDWDRLQMEDMDDWYLLEQPQPRIMPDADFGIYYYKEKFFAGFSTKHLFEKYFADWTKINTNLPLLLNQNMYLYIGGFINIRKEFIYKPSILIKYVDDGSWGFDANSCLMVYNLFWIGISYRSNHNSFVFMTDIKVNSKLRIGYSYDTYLSDIQHYSIGTHEIRISYDAQQLQKRRYRRLYY